MRLLLTYMRSDLNSKQRSFYEQRYLNLSNFNTSRESDLVTCYGHFSYSAISPATYIPYESMLPYQGRKRIMFSEVP